MKGSPDRIAGFSHAPAEIAFRGFSSRKTPLYGRLPSRERLTPRGSGTPQCGRIAQLVEQLTLNQRVLGSSPSASTIFSMTYQVMSASVISSGSK